MRLCGGSAGPSPVSPSLPPYPTYLSYTIYPIVPLIYNALYCTLYLCTWHRYTLHYNIYNAVIYYIYTYTYIYTGNVLAVSTGDNKVTLWKQTVDQTWVEVCDIDPSSTSTTAAAMTN